MAHAQVRILAIPYAGCLSAISQTDISLPRQWWRKAYGTCSFFALLGWQWGRVITSRCSSSFEGSYWDNFPLEKLWMACASIAGTILITVLACVEYFSIADRDANERTPLITECNERRPLIAEVGM
eukprot:GEMP01097770.1.p1 GENE.GEMP01097770.1~~GEMP01097770.1.p1  ORF type:complete len:126 (+),score=16.89 GEMP01097770.1:209-586(+)